MKFTTINLLALTVATLALSSASSSAALLLTFTEEGGNVVVRSTGSLDLTNGVMFSTGSVAQNGGSSQSVSGNGFAAYETFSKGQVYGGFRFNATPITTISPMAGPPLTFSITGLSANSGLILQSNQGILQVASDNAMDPGGVFQNLGVVAPLFEMTIEGVSFSDVGLDAHTLDTEIDLWGVSATATSDEKITMMVSSSVPEPSSTALLLCLGLMALATGRWNR